MSLSSVFKRGWDVNSLWVTDLASATTPRGISCVHLDLEGTRLAAADYSGKIYIVSTSNGKLLSHFSLSTTEAGWTPAATAVQWSPDGKVLAVGDDYRGHLHIFSPTGEEMINKRVHSNAVSQIRFLAGGKIIATGGDDTRVRFWKCPELEACGRIHVGESRDFAVAAQKRMMATVRKAGGPGPERVIELRDLNENGLSKEVLQGHCDLINCLEFSTREDLLVSGSGHWEPEQNHDSTVALWKTDSDQMIFKEKIHELGVAGVLFAMDDAVIISVGYDGRIVTWSVASDGKQTSVVQRLSPAQCACFAEKTQILVVGFKDGNVEGLSIVRGSTSAATVSVSSSAMSQGGHEEESTPAEDTGPRGDDYEETSGPITGSTSRSLSQRLARKRRSMPKAFTNSIGMWLQLIEPGEFIMGSPDNIGLPDEHPEHKIIMPKRFYIGIYQITQTQYKRITGKSPSGFAGRDNPVETVTWYDAMAFCDKLSKEEGRTYRLPTEAEWEFCCKAGGNGRYCCGDSAGELAGYCWFGKNSDGTTHPVGRKDPNEWGLYDMHGNVWEWCMDYYDENFYKNSPEINPQGPETGKLRVVRGGAYDVQNAVICRSAGRLAEEPATKSDALGFRVIFELRNVK
ncbi:MAG TPA: SUMF1/EgtB/PvdO family nonheme iron enzyme [Candidatus Brocadiia bacterium]|nr:SUMF1/EgtB/PvdO family nonheme iron enzyme [Candidatus Brocadiia bacterium]